MKKLTGLLFFLPPIVLVALIIAFRQPEPPKIEEPAVPQFGVRYGHMADEVREDMERTALLYPIGPGKERQALHDGMAVTENLLCIIANQEELNEALLERLDATEGGARGIP